MRDHVEKVLRRRPNVLILAGTAAVLVAALVPTTAHLYVDAAWFASLGRSGVFRTIVTTQLGLAVVTGFVAFAFVYANLRICVGSAARTPTVVVRGPDGMAFDLIRPLRRFVLPVAVVAGLSSALVSFNRWDVWLLFVHGARFGMRDPIFGRDLAFYVFDLPLYLTVRSMASTLLLSTMVLCAFGYLLQGGLAVLRRPVRAERHVRVHLSLLGAGVLAIFGWDAWLDASELLYSTTGPVRGASYADVYARLPALKILCAVALIGSVSLAFSATRARLFFLVAPVVAYTAVNLIGVRLYPAIVQRFSVAPNEAAKERPFIRHNIRATRAAYGLADVSERELKGHHTLAWRDIEANRATIDNIRLWDHQPLLDTFAQIQEIRTYYEFVSVDNDRYVIDGVSRQTLLSPRELSVESLPNRTWINERFTFTHGYGITLGPVNETTTEGLPVLYIRDIPPKTVESRIVVRRPAIYFGELSNDYAFVRTRNREFDYPSGEQNVYARYRGKDGISLRSGLLRSMLAVRLGSLKILLSEDIGDQSRVLLYRSLQERLTKLVPFLELDRDPYMVVRDDGTLVWIQDAYTTTSRYPYAEPTSRGINYIRNSVKITIDAYDGTVTLYAVDARDPILRTWRRVFPGMFQPLSSMPKDLRAHVRYPEDLFRTQAEMFAVYHMDQPELVYNREDQWEIPTIANEESAQRMEPYYTIMRLPGGDRPEFILMLPFTPKRKDNLAAWMVARSDGENLGRMVVYRFPKDRLVFGPQQVMNRINQDAEISRQISLWDQRGSQALFGTLLVIPVEESLLYVCPLYLRSSGGRIPELKRVIVVHENRIAMAETLDRAIATVFDRDAPPTATESRAIAQTAASPSEPASPVPATEGGVPRDLRLRAAYHYGRAVAAQRRGDWAGYGEELDALGKTVEALAKQAPQKAP